MFVKVFAAELRPAGEFVNTDTGEVLQYGIRTACKVWLPDAEYPSDAQIKGELPLGMGYADLVVSLKKEVLSAKLVNFKLGVLSSAAAVPVGGSRG